MPFHVVETPNPCFYEQPNLIDSETQTDYINKSKLDNSLSQKYFQNVTRPSNSDVSKEHSDLQSTYPLELNVCNLPSQILLDDDIPVKKSQSAKIEEIKIVSDYSLDNNFSQYESPPKMSFINDCPDESENSISHGRKVFKKKHRLNQFSRMGSFRGKPLFKKFGSSLEVIQLFFFNIYNFKHLKYTFVSDYYLSF